MIKEKRLALHYTQEKMAALLEISTRQYQRIDKEEDIPRRDILKKLITILNMNDEELGRYIRNMIEQTKKESSK